jgi:hypothetical protein
MNRPIGVLLGAGLAALLLVGCAGSGTGGSGSGDRLVTEDIGSVDVSNLYEVVQRLRPRWLDARGARGFQTDAAVVVFLDRTYLGRVEELRNLGPETAASLQFMRGAQAQAELRVPSGVNVAAAIIVHTVDRNRE